MERDSHLARNLRKCRDDVDAREGERDAALHRLRQASMSAYEALTDGPSSATVARAIGIGASTLRKLNAAGEQVGWRMLSLDKYIAIDAYTQRVLKRTWYLTAFREAFDKAEAELAEAQKLLLKLSAEMDAGVAFELGILLIPGVPEQGDERVLERLGDALAAAFNKGRDREGGTVRVVDTTRAGDDEPAHLTLRGPGPNGGEEGTAGSEWLVAASAVDHGVSGDPALREFLGWLFLTLPWLAADVLDRRAARTRGLAAPAPARWARSAGNAVVSAATIPLLLLGVIVIALLRAALFVPGLRVAGRGGSSRLLRIFGLTFAYAHGPSGNDALLQRAVKDLAWLRLRCRRIAVVAHGQGAPTAHDLVAASGDDMVQLLATLGSSVRRVRFARALHGRPDQALSGLNGLLWSTMTSSLGVLVTVQFTWLIALLVGLPAGPGLIASAVASCVALLAVTALIGAAGRRQLHSDLLPIRLRAGSDQPPALAAMPPWLALATARDPVADGPYLMATAPLGEVPLDVVYQASPLTDHLAYLKPETEAFQRLLGRLVELAPPPLPPPPRLPGAAAATRRRVPWLRAARWVAAASGGLVAVWLAPRLSSSLPRMPTLLAVGAFVALWAGCAALTAGLLRYCWLLWDFAERRYDLAADPRPGQEPSSERVPTFYMGFAFFLVMLALAAAWPVAAMLGWWDPVIRSGIGVAEGFHGGNPALTGLSVVIEAVLVLLGVTVALGLLLLRRPVRRRLERWWPLPDPVAAAALLIRLLPEDGLVVGDRRYRTALVSWDVSVRRRGRRIGLPRCALPRRMLAAGDAILLDLRESCVEGQKVAHVHGSQVYEAVGPGRSLRLARWGDWRAFRRDLRAMFEVLEAAAVEGDAVMEAGPTTGRPSRRSGL